MTVSEDEKARIVADEEIRENVRKKRLRTVWDYANTPAVLWGLGVLCLSVIPFLYAGCQANLDWQWQRWDKQRKLTVEMRYRIAQLNDMLQNKTIATGKTTATDIEKVLNNTEDAFRTRFIVPEYRDRSLDSLEWELVASYGFDTPEKERIMTIQTDSRMAIEAFADTEEARKLTLKHLQSAEEALKTHWQEIMDNRPLIPPLR